MVKRVVICGRLPTELSPAPAGDIRRQDMAPGRNRRAAVYLLLFLTDSPERREVPAVAIGEFHGRGAIYASEGIALGYSIPLFPVQIREEASLILFWGGKS